MQQTCYRTLHTRRHVDIQPPVQLAIVGDRPGVVVAVWHLVSGARDFEVVGEVNDADRLLAMLARVCYNLAITDYTIPGSRYGGGILLLEFPIHRHPDLQPMILTALEIRTLMSNILRAGIKVIVSKSDEPQHTLGGMQAAVDGRIYLSPLLNVKLFCRNGEPQPTHDDPVTKFDERELGMLCMCVTGKTISEIAQQLNRSVKTINSQKQTVMRKLELSTEATLFDLTMRHGLLGSGGS